MQSSCMNKVGINFAPESNRFHGVFVVCFFFSTKILFPLKM